MERVSYDYYKNSYGGKLSSDNFERYASTAEDVVALATGFGGLGDDLTRGDGGKKEAFLRAVCIEIDYIAEFDKGAAPDGRSLIRESLGDYSVTYADAGGRTVDGIQISPKAMLCLRRAGLLSRWV